jgi:hypothetical protein
VLLLTLGVVTLGSSPTVVDLCMQMPCKLSHKQRTNGTTWLESEDDRVMRMRVVSTLHIVLRNVLMYLKHDYVSGRPSISVRRTRGVLLLVSTTHYCNPFCFQHESCPRLTPLPPRPRPRPTFNQSSMPPSRHMRRRQSASLSLILLQPNCSAATPPSPFYPPFKNLSSNSITVAAVMRD